MTAAHTLPIPRIAATTHEHAWIAESRHPTSDGIVVYVRCGGCEARRVDLQEHPHSPPSALSRPTADA